MSNRMKGPFLAALALLTLTALAAQPPATQPRATQPRTTQPRATQPRTAQPQATQPPAQDSRSRAATVLAPRAMAPVLPVRAEPLVVRRDPADRKAILVGNLGTREAPAVYRTRKDVLYELAVAPDNRYTAAIESTDGILETGENGEREYRVPPRNELVILDARGQVVRRVEEDVRHYIFSPDGGSIAYVVGSYYEGGVGFEPEGVFVMEIATGATEKVDAGGVYELSWTRTETEDALHLRTLATAVRQKVQRYDFRTRRLSAVPSGAFHVSPDAAFYLKQPYELIEEGTCQGRQGAEPCFQVYDRKTERPVSARVPQELGQPLGWAYAEGHLLAFSRVERKREERLLQLGRLPVKSFVATEPLRAETVVWDVSTAKVVRRVPGLALASRSTSEWTGSLSELAVRPVEPAPAAPGAFTVSPQLRRKQELQRVILTRPPGSETRSEPPG